MYKLTNKLDRRIGLPAEDGGVILNIGESVEVSDARHDEFMETAKTQGFILSGALVSEKVEEPPVKGWDE